ncbi:tubulin-like doman-containing protein [Microbacterium sp.]|uniref:tubulin-like doman-containing protein n=1 Tax=Microbacterium sp. TaxID=51671 RepID=UPI0039E57849
MPIAPTLILGLGGTGSKIVEKVATKVGESASTQSDRIAYTVFDTDINDLGRIRREHPEIFTVQTSTRNTVGEYLNINTNARDNWFPVNQMLNRKTLTEGAAQVRAISRLAFDTTLKGGNLDALHRAIDKLFRLDKDQEEQALRVIITSSLAGGTGSGLILSVAMYLADYLRAKYPKAKAITRGFFVQPDVFDKVIKATEERQNLQVNAYAAVRELDAFLMKGDSTLPPQYRDLAFEFPRVGADGVDTVDAMPYDFCFLFDAKNSGGGSLDSFETYLDHAATCIYTQSIGPMSKKSNSREDNVLREVIKNDGRNRYAGAGASRLVYPWAHVRDYVALRWTEQVLSAQWLRFDDQFKKTLEGLAKQREKGLSPRDPDIAAEYVKAVNGAAANKNGFAKAVVAQCTVMDEDGLDSDLKRWEEYLSALTGYVVTQSATMGDPHQRNIAMDQVTPLTEDTERSRYLNAYREVKKYHDVVARRTEESAGILSYELFHADDVAVTAEKHSHRLETYLRDKDTDRFIHPVTARYFLYNTLALLKDERRRVENELTSLREYFENFERNAFDDPSTDEVETAEGILSRKLTIREKLTRKPSAEMQDLQQLLLGYIPKVDALLENAVLSEVLGEAIEYVSGIAEAFRTLFLRLDSNIRRLKGEVELQRTKYDDLSGSTTRYVLATSASLDSLAEGMPYAGGVVNIDSSLSEAIYNRVRGYYMLTDEKDDTYFEDLYRTTIQGYFRDKVMESYGNVIKIDIIEALEKEYRTLQRNLEESKVRHYVIDEIEKAKQLAKPFIEQPLGEERHPIEACAYNSGLEGEADPRRKALVSEHLRDYGGEPDGDISAHEILFYNAIYGIRARDLPKYSPARTSATLRRDAGEYFSAYYALVSGIKPSVSETKVITPHIDRRWHWISQLPDLDEENQAAQLRGIHDALLLGLVHEKIFWSEVHDGLQVYRYSSDQPLDQDFIVSNGTPCDHFWEVVDALTINPVAVAEIVESIERRSRAGRDLARSVTFAETDFARGLAKGIRLREADEVIPALSGTPLNVLDIAAFYAFTVTKELYNERQVHDMVTDFLARIRFEVEQVEQDAEALPTLKGIVLEQFRDFASHVDAYSAVGGRPLLQKLRRVIRPVSDLFDEIGERAAAEEVARLDAALRNA